MLSLKVAQTTFFKASTQQSDNLPVTQKALVNANREFQVKSYSKKDGHFFVTLDEPIMPVGDSGFFFDKHIQIEEIRSIWITNVDSDILDSPDNLTRGMTKLKELKFNTIYPVIWNRGFTLYPSEVAEKVIGSKVADKFKDRET